ncbi:MAG: hypothetical protein K8E66_09140, partial [Phycisphaerales bacterium]|nr:hypothetical protein [Phycisphaerales bacterium]
MLSIKTLSGISAAGVLAFAITPVSAVGDCCTALVTTSDIRNEVLGNIFCASNWYSPTMSTGKACLPIGTGYACGAQRTLTVGQEYTLSADLSIGGDGGGVTIGASTTLTVSEATQHTAGNCQSCQFFASYSGVELREWDVASFYIFSQDQKKRYTFWKGGAPTIMPCCETNNNCAGCPEGESGGIAFADPEYTAAGVDNRGSPGEVTYIVDLRVPDFFSPIGVLPPWHPMISPGTTLATLNCWQLRSIMREVMWMSMIQTAPVTELVILDTDGTPLVIDLVANP